MSIVITFDVTAKSGQVDQLKALFTETLPDTRNFDGCVSVSLYTESDSPDTVFMVEQWASKAAYENYLGWRQKRGDMEKLMALVNGEPVIRFFDQV